MLVMPNLPMFHLSVFLMLDLRILYPVLNPEDNRLALDFLSAVLDGQALASSSCCS